MEIGKKIKDLRIAKGLTQEELADRSELSKGFISQLERDLTSPAIAPLTELLQVLGRSLTDFFSDAPIWIVLMRERNLAMSLPERSQSISEIRVIKPKKGKPFI